MTSPTKLALIPPFSMMDEVSGGYYMYLPQLMKSSHYVDFIRRTNVNGAYTMLDNGAFEGVETSPRDLIELAVRMDVDEIVIPDAMQDMKGTIDAADHFYSTTTDLRLGRAVGLKYMAVPQGHTIEECMNCIDAFAGFTFINTIGLPKHLIRTVTRTARTQLAAYIRRKYGDRFEIHMLGASPLWPQEIKSARRYNIRGMDTSLPYFYAFYNRSIEDRCSNERPEAYFVRTREEFNYDVLLENVHALSGWCRD